MTTDKFRNSVVVRAMSVPAYCTNAKCQDSLSIDEWVLAWTIILAPRAFAEGRVAAMHESVTGPSGHIAPPRELDR